MSQERTRAGVLRHELLAVVYVAHNVRARRLADAPPKSVIAKGHDRAICLDTVDLPDAVPIHVLIEPASRSPLARDVAIGVVLQRVAAQEADAVTYVGDRPPICPVPHDVVGKRVLRDQGRTAGAQLTKL